MPEAELRQMRADDAIVQTVVSSPDDIVYISGSLIEGFGNPSSDIDVFLVTPGEPEYRGPFASVLGDFYLDLEVYTRSRMLELAERLAALDPADFRAVWLTPAAELDLYYRTLIGRPFHNADGFEAMLAGFRRDVVERLLAAWCGLHCAASLQHAREELDAGRPVNAALAAQAAAASSLDSYLAAHGEAFPSLKWRFEKLARLEGAASPRYARAWSLKAAAARGPASYLDDVAAFASELGMDTYSAWTLGEVPLQPSGELETFEVAGDAYAMQNQRFVYAIDGSLRAVFGLLRDGSPTRADLARALGPEPARQMVAALQARNLVRAY
jgi:predicted nucleotidyltransferase